MRHNAWSSSNSPRPCPLPGFVNRRVDSASPSQLFLADLGPQLQPPGCPLTVHRWLEVPNNASTPSTLPTLSSEGGVGGALGKTWGRAQALSNRGSGKGEEGRAWLPGEVHVKFEFKHTGPPDSTGFEIGALGLSLPMVREVERM